MNELLNRLGYQLRRYGPSGQIIYLTSPNQSIIAPVWYILVDRVSLRKDLSAIKRYDWSTPTDGYMEYAFHVPWAMRPIIV